MHLKEYVTQLIIAAGIIIHSVKNGAICKKNEVVAEIVNHDMHP